MNVNVSKVITLMEQVQCEYAQYLIECDKDFCPTELEEWKMEALEKHNKDLLIKNTINLIEGR